MSSIRHWRLVDELNVFQAAFIILGLDPASFGSSVEDLFMEDKKEGFVPISIALKNAVKFDRLNANINYYYDANGESQISWTETFINVEDLKSWLESKHFTDNFFFQESKVEEYLDPSNVYFAPKLCAAVHAWQAVTSDLKLMDGNTPKQAMDKWLRQNANQYGLTKDDGNPNESAIAEISKIANWNPNGGVAKSSTTGSLEPNPLRVETGGRI